MPEIIGIIIGILIIIFNKHSAKSIIEIQGDFADTDLSKYIKSSRIIIIIVGIGFIIISIFRLLKKI